MMKFLRRVCVKLGLVPGDAEQDVEQMLADRYVEKSEAPAAPFDPCTDTREFTQVEVNNIHGEREALDAEAALQEAMDSHSATVMGNDPALQELSRKLKLMDQQAAGEFPAQA